MPTKVTIFHSQEETVAVYFSGQGSWVLSEPWSVDLAGGLGPEAVITGPDFPNQILVDHVVRVNVD